MRYSHIVFDLDGTLVESLPGIAVGLNAALRSLGYAEHSEDAIRLMIGEGARRLCAHALGYGEDDVPAELIDSLLVAFKREYRHSWDAGATACYDGIAALLDLLVQRGVTLALLSNKPHDMTTLIVESLMPQVPFTHVLGYQEGVFARKPQPDALLHIAECWGIEIGELLLVGDSIHDAHCAENAACQLALVSWGYAQQDKLRAYCDAREIPLMRDVAALSELLCREDTGEPETQSL